MRIGLVGEAPHDTLSIKNLLEKKYKPEEYTFFEMQKFIRGSMLDNPKTKHLLRKEYEIEKPDFIIFIRDLDAFIEDKVQFVKRKEYFRDFNSVVDKKGVFLLNIFEIEALILNEISVFNNLYSTTIDGFANVMLVADPKEVLLQSCRKYNQGHNAEIFALLDFDNALNCEYFEKFIKRFEKFLTV